MEPMSLLVVHPDAAFAESARELFARAGYRVRTAPAPPDGGAAANEVVVIDPDLPGADTWVVSARRRGRPIVPVAAGAASDARALLRPVHRAAARVRAQVAAHRRAGRLAESTEFVHAVAVAVTSTLDLDAILSIAAEHAKELVRAEAASVLLVDEARGELVFDATAGGCAEVRTVRLRLDQGIAGWVATHVEAALCTDPSSDPRFCTVADRTTGFVTRSIAAVPLCAGGRVLGVLEAVNAVGRGAFDETDLEAMGAVAPHIAVALQNARVAQELRRSREQALRLSDRLEEKVQERTGQLQLAKTEWESTFDAIAEPIAILQGLTVRRANRAYAEAAGVVVTQVPDRPCHALLAGRGDPCPGCPIAGRVEGPADVAIRGRIFRVSGFEVPGSARQVVHYRDVSAERALAGRLRESERLAAVGQLAAGAAHEINNPLGFIASNLSSLRRVADGAAGLVRRLETAAATARAGAAARAAALVVRACDEAQEQGLGAEFEDGGQAVAESLGGVARVAAIVRALKELADDELGEAAAVDVVACLERSVKRAGERETPAPVVWERRDGGTVRGHTLQLERAFYEVARNAVQAVAGRAPVRLATTTADGEVAVTIADEGPGMSDEVRARAFDPFFSTRGVGGGIGLGLTRAWATVRRHGGRVEIQSRPGAGTTVRIVLPLAEPSSNPLREPRRSVRNHNLEV